MQLLLSALAVAGSDLVSSLAFPPVRLRLLAFVGLIPFFLVIRRGGLAAALGWTWLWAILGAWAVASAFPASLANFYLQPLWVGWAISLGLWTLMAAIYYMAFTPVYRRLAGHFPLVLPWLVAAAWVGVELARGRLFTGSEFLIGNPWGLLGYSLAGPGPMAQIAAWTGVYGLSFAVVAANAGLTELVIASRKPGRPSRRVWVGSLLGLLPALGIWAHGEGVLQGAPPADRREGMVEIGVVQGNVSLGSRWRSEFYGRNLDIYLDLTRQLLVEGRPRLIVWPEAAFTFFLEHEPAYLRAIGRVLEHGETELIAGGPSGREDQSLRFYNSVFHLDAQGALQERYDKQHLVPFSEFFPWQGFDMLKRSFEGARTFIHGAPGPPFTTRAGRSGILVCNEAMLPEVAADRVAAGAELLVSPSNDGWIADAGFAAHMADVVALRAVEQHRYLIRASTSGPSMVVDPWGRTRVTTAWGDRQILLGLVKAEHQLTPYFMLGDAFALGCAGAAALALLAVAWVDRSRGSAPEA